MNMRIYPILPLDINQSKKNPARLLLFYSPVTLVSSKTRKIHGLNGVCSVCYPEVERYLFTSADKRYIWKMLYPDVVLSTRKQNHESSHFTNTVIIVTKYSLRI